MKLAFRRMTEADLPQLHRWLELPHVAEHYNDKLADLAAVTAYYLPVIDGTDHAHAFFIVVDGVEVGYIQTYRIADHPEYAAALALGVDAAGIDIFIGELSHAHRGLGAPILLAFLDVVWDVTGCEIAAICPATDNPIAIRAYEKAGFAHVKTVTVPGSPKPEYAMLKPRGA